MESTCHRLKRLQITIPDNTLSVMTHVYSWGCDLSQFLWDHSPLPLSWDSPSPTTRTMNLNVPNIYRSSKNFNLPSAPSLSVPIISNQLQTAPTAPVSGPAAFSETRAWSTPTHSNSLGLYCPREHRHLLTQSVLPGLNQQPSFLQYLIMIL